MKQKWKMSKKKKGQAIDKQIHFNFCLKNRQLLNLKLEREAESI